MSLAALLFLQQASTVVMSYPALENCYRDRSENCRIDIEKVTPFQLGLLNKLITEAITNRADGSPLDPWVSFPADRQGDCDDDVATKRAALGVLGFPASAMTVEMREVTEPDGRLTGHLVLIVQLKAGRYVMDRKMPEGVYGANARPYAWRVIATQSREAVTWTMP